MRIVFVGDIKQRGNKDEAANSKINNATGKMEHAGVEEVLHSVAPPKKGQKKTTVRVHRGSVLFEGIHVQVCFRVSVHLL